MKNLAHTLLIMRMVEERTSRGRVLALETTEECTKRWKSDTQ